MLFISKVQTKIAGISFTVPKSFCISREDAKPYGVVLIPPEHCRIDLFRVNSNSTDNIKEALISSLKDKAVCLETCKIEEQIEKNLYSVKAQYEYGDIECLEIHFGQQKGYNNRLVLLITVKASNLNAILKHKDIKKFIASFKINR